MKWLERLPLHLVRLGGILCLLALALILCIAKANAEPPPEPDTAEAAVFDGISAGRP
ncbi:MAG: hypothetical protein GWO11_05230 [Desulfuromonadales bacterium]|nr:hypothetical protein [Desulfuromonadales bacterium]